MGEGGTIARISGSAVTARGLEAPRMYNLVRVGTLGLAGEIIRVEKEQVTIQVYEDTTGLGLGEPVIDSGEPLMAELGPGLAGSLFDGVQRPLREIAARSGHFIPRGCEAAPLNRGRRWEFVPWAAAGDRVGPGDILGVVEETEVIEHRVLVPPGVEGRIDALQKGPLLVTDSVARLEGGGELTMMQRWPVRTPRPVLRKLEPETLFVTGQRVFDTFFPLAEGGTAVVPGGFGTGKTVVQHSLAKFAAADVIVYIGCGERGNEIAEVLAEFPSLTDPYRGLPLSERTVIIANTSNMPVAAREASLYTGITVAEYYRDQGYRVALMADSTSRWAEALREISSRLEELPGEEGYPTYLASRLSSFYERGGRARCLGERDWTGSVTMICAISPPGGDFSEPVTQSSLRVAGTLWALDPSLAHRRHFPAVNPKLSYSLYHESLHAHLASRVDRDWTENARRAMGVMQKEEELQEVVQLVGIEAVPDEDRVLLEAGRMIRETFLTQNAFHEVDAFCSLQKQHDMLEIILELRKLLLERLASGVPLETLLELPLRDLVSRLKEVPDEGYDAGMEKIRTAIAKMLERLPGAPCPAALEEEPEEEG